MEDPAQAAEAPLANLMGWNMVVHPELLLPKSTGVPANEEEVSVSSLAPMAQSSKG